MWFRIINRYAIKRIMQLSDMQLTGFDCMSVRQKNCFNKTLQHASNLELAAPRSEQDRYWSRAVSRVVSRIDAGRQTWKQVDWVLKYKSFRLCSSPFMFLVHTWVVIKKFNVLLSLWSAGKI